MLSETTKKRLIRAALRARANAYAPYSGFRVGAAVLAEGGGIYPGANVENATFGATICAERSAVSAAVSAGERRLDAVAIATGTSPPSPPCGICRQVLSEFGRGMAVILVNDQGDEIDTDLEKLLPMNFSLRKGLRGKT
ncbi:MAG: cytidine deaminase [Deltaproteobacteria bacterium]|nr:cytidine deaminase [Deltaproteobacteria bacterium]